MASALRQEGHRHSALGWTADGQVILDVSLLRKLTEQARGTSPLSSLILCAHSCLPAVLEWGYRRSEHTGNRQALEWIKANLLTARDYRVPDVFVYATWLENRVEHQRMEKPNLTTPRALLQPHLPSKRPLLTRSQSTRSASITTSAAKHGASTSL
jgi:hypothetical protein